MPKVEFTQCVIEEFNKAGEAVLIPAIKGYEIVLELKRGKVHYQYVKNRTK